MSISRLRPTRLHLHSLQTLTSQPARRLPANHSPSRNLPNSTAAHGHPYSQHLRLRSPVPPIYINKCEINVTLGVPSDRYGGSGGGGGGSGGGRGGRGGSDGSSNRSRSDFGSDSDGRRRPDSGMLRYDSDASRDGSSDGVYASARSKELVLRLDVQDDKTKQKIIKIVSGLPGMESLVLDVKKKKLTVIGDVDLVMLVTKLRKLCSTEVSSVGPAAKGLEKKKDEPKKDEGKKVEKPKKDEKKDEGKKKDKDEQIAELVKAYRAYNPYMTTYYHVRSSDENPSACVIL